jgi:hypothetical protein
MEQIDRVTLICGQCGRSREMRVEEWARYKERRAKNGTVVLCDKPSAVRGSKSKCLGVLDEQKHKTE